MQTMAEREEAPMERVDEKFQRVDERFDEVNRRITETRGELKTSFEQVDKRFDRIEGDIRELKRGDIREVKGEIGEVREGLLAVQASFNRFVIGAATSWVVLMVTILVKG
jgi:tetrahydromethanopterin S-methyltransferase subunit G